MRFKDEKNHVAVLGKCFCNFTIILINTYDPLNYEMQQNYLAKDAGFSQNNSSKILEIYQGEQ